MRGSASETESTYEPGQVVAGKYVIESVVGRGAMGIVVRARHAELDEPVALKFLRAAWVGEPELVARFAREARAVVKLRSEHAARVLDVGKTDDGTPFMVMELLEGEDLAAVMRRGAIDVADAVDWVLEACDALAEAHVNGIVHRDVKPENLFLIERHGRGQVKLLDFGVSKTALTGGAVADALHETTSMVGTPLYMSPEQVRRSRDADPRADIWSLGCVLYELLSHRPPVLADSLPEVCALILEAEPTPVRELRPEVDERLADVIARCLAKHPGDRYPCIAELAMDLLPFAHRRQHGTVEHITRIQRLAGLTRVHLASVAPGPSDRASAPLPIPPSAPVPLDLVVTRTNDFTVERKGQGTPLGVWFAAGAVLAVGLGVAIWAARRPDPAAVSPIATPAASVAAAAHVESSSPPPPPEPAPSAVDPRADTKLAEPAAPVRTARAAPSAKKPPPDAPPAASATESPKPPLEIKMER
ncbi:MAG: serine/threonine protein kinase [Polyangiaceae bacterium]|nr:serine/threonine protein kinase [Polyangiaceae bacterium]